jgi:hypothetical protein
MLNDYRKSMKIIMLSPKMKSLVITTTVLLLIGLVFSMTTTGTDAIGAIYVFLPVSSLTQLFYGANEAGIIMSSPLKKKTQTYYPFLYVVPYTAIAYIIMCTYHIYMALHGEGSGIGSEVYTMEAKFIFGLSIMVLVDYLYTATCYKNFVVSTIGFIGAVLPLCVFIQSKYIAMNVFARANIYKVLVVGSITVIIGIVAAIIITNILYNKDIDWRSQKGIVRQ